jgi:adenine-specific DNA-methyltransferase
VNSTILNGTAPDRRPVIEAPAKQSDLGQFLTPSHVAMFMASLFTRIPREVELLDAGAGAGALTGAFVRRACSTLPRPQSIRVTAFEVDPGILGRLRATLADCTRLCERIGIEFSAVVRQEDFIAAAVPSVRGELFVPAPPGFNMAIVNPPYRKIRSDSVARLLLRSAGIETVNLYTGFLALIIRLLRPGGELVAITPRSFCNGPYFRPFRLDFLETMSLRRLHVFESRSAAFSEDDVLQENIIVHAVKGAPAPEDMLISNSSGAAGGPVVERVVPFREVVSGGDPERFVHLPAHGCSMDVRAALRRFTATLTDLGLAVSTGRVVDFRAKELLRRQPSVETAPLIYPCHFNGGFVHWPKPDARKPNAIVRTDSTADLLVPAGVYVLVKRFTAKEERRRLVACVYDPSRVPADAVGFENHLNYFHVEGRGLSMCLAKGLALFLNSTLTDQFFREFSGHTQVNATDLRSLRYPSRADLERLGARVDDPGLPQTEVDELVEEELF